MQDMIDKNAEQSESSKQEAEMPDILLGYPVVMVAHLPEERRGGLVLGDWFSYLTFKLRRAKKRQ